jgi:hypothetical protein
VFQAEGDGGGVAEGGDEEVQVGGHHQHVVAGHSHPVCWLNTRGRGEGRGGEGVFVDVRRYITDICYMYIYIHTYIYTYMYICTHRSTMMCVPVWLSERGSEVAMTTLMRRSVCAMQYSPFDEPFLRS